MKEHEVLAKMRTKPPRTIWYPMQLAQSGAAQLRRMEDKGLVSSQRRYGGNERQRDYFLTEAQHKTADAPAPGHF